jgi:hypothetical protein
MAKKTVVLYHYFEASEEYEQNLHTFLQLGYRADVDYIIIIAGGCSLELPRLNNVKYVYAPNFQFDYQNPPFKYITTNMHMPPNTSKNPIMNFELLESMGVSRLDRLLNDAKINSDPTNISTDIININLVILRSVHNNKQCSRTSIVLAGVEILSNPF